MAEELFRLDLERAQSEWVKTGLAGLSDELRGELDPHEVANRTVTYLARYVQAPVGALYCKSAEGSFKLLGSYAVPQGHTPDEFQLGEGLVGQAATRSGITIVRAPDDASLPLRSGLV